MSLLVMDGVRKRRSGGTTIMLRAAAPAATAEAVLPLPSAWAGGAGSLDGLRRVARSMAPTVAADVITVDEQSTASERSFSPYAIASLAAIPMLAAGSIVGTRFYLANHAQVTASAKANIVPAAEAAPVAPTDQAAIAPVPAQAQSMQALLDGFGQSSTYSYYVKDLKTGQLAVVGPDRAYRSASFYKLFVASEIYHRIDTGQFTYASPAGNGNSVAGCLNLMITISDNDCGNALGSLIGWNNLTQLLHAGGYTATNLNQPMMTTPRDVAKIFERLYEGSLLSPDSTAQFMNLLKGQKVNNRLPQGLPAGTTFAHKTGDLNGYMHDGGIVFGPKTDYLVVMMGAPGASTGDFASLSQKLYRFFNQ